MRLINQNTVLAGYFNSAHSIFILMASFDTVNKTLTKVWSQLWERRVTVVWWLLIISTSNIRFPPVKPESAGLTLSMRCWIIFVKYYSMPSMPTSILLFRPWLIHNFCNRCQEKYLFTTNQSLENYFVFSIICRRICSEYIVITNPHSRNVIIVEGNRFPTGISFL